MRCERTVACIATLGSLLLVAQPARSADNCTCRGNDRDIPVGETVCLKTASGGKLARCETVLNNTSWKILAPDCPVAALAREPAHDRS